MMSGSGPLPALDKVAPVKREGRTIFLSALSALAAPAVFVSIIVLRKVNRRVSHEARFWNKRLQHEISRWT
jgi:hypothetical protein